MVEHIFGEDGKMGERGSWSTFRTISMGFGQQGKSVQQAASTALRSVGPLCADAIAEKLKTEDVAHRERLVAALGCVGPNALPYTNMLSLGGLFGTSDVFLFFSAGNSSMLVTWLYNLLSWQKGKVTVWYNLLSWKKGNISISVQFFFFFK